jgi:RNA polymerase sigma factor (sigma-70 family)
MAPVNAPSRGQTTRFQEGPKECPHSSLYKRLTLAEAPVVNGASDHLLAGTRLALDEYRRVCRCNNSNWEDAEDVVQESLLKAFRHLGQFRGTCSFSSWLTRIAINSALMLMRKRRVRLETSYDRGAPRVKPIRYRSELPAAPSRADPGRHVAWRALGLGVKDLPLLVCQVTFMAHSCVDAVKQSAHRRQPDQAS